MQIFHHAIARLRLLPMCFQTQKGLSGISAKALFLLVAGARNHLNLLFDASGLG